MKKITAFILALVLAAAMCVPVMAENTDADGNLTITEDMPFDVCMHNIWADKDAECIYPTVETVGLTLTVSGYTGDPITTQLIVRESTTWLHWQSDTVEITGDGTYTYYIDMSTKKGIKADTGEEVGGPFDSSTLCTIFVKDVNCCSEEESPLGKGEAASGVACDVHAEKVVFNKEAPGSEGDASKEDSTGGADSENGDKENEGTKAEGSAGTQASSEGDGKAFLPVPAIIGIACAAVCAVIIVVVVVTKKKKA